VLPLIGKGTDARIESAVATFVPWLFFDSDVEAIARQSLATTRGKVVGADREALKRLSNRALSDAPRPGLADVLRGDEQESRLRSLLHMHCNRFGVQPNLEYRSLVLLRSVLLSKTARTKSDAAIVPRAHALA